MSKERTVITQQLCDHVKALLAGRLTISQAAKFANVGEATVGRIKAAGYDAEQYRKNMRAQKQREQEEKKKRSAVNKIFSQSILIAREEDNQVPGQMEMQLTQPESEKHEEIETWLAALYNQQEQIIQNEGNIIKAIEGLHRYIAGKTGLLSETLDSLLTKMDKQTDYLGQMLRRTDK